MTKVTNSRLKASHGTFLLVARNIDKSKDLDIKVVKRATTRHSMQAHVQG